MFGSSVPSFVCRRAHVLFTLFVVVNRTTAFVVYFSTVDWSVEMMNPDFSHVTVMHRQKNKIFKKIQETSCYYKMKVSLT
jgi:hypothetical protein